jgi:hypothetical protein
MESIFEILKNLLANIDWGSLSAGMIITALIITLYSTFTPNKRVYNFFFKIGKKASGLGKKYLGEQRWEKVENNLLGTILSAANGLQDGANSDDEG